MKVSRIGLISKKIDKIDKQFPGQDILVQTGQIEQFSSGIYAYGHIPFLLKNIIDKKISEVLTKYDCAELLLPMLQPESIWIESNRLEKYVAEDLMFRCLTSKGNYCLAPTAEEAIVHFIKSRINTYRQLPITFFQNNQKFRNEIRTRGLLLRGKAFEMLDAYSFGRNQSDLDIEYERMKLAFLEIFKDLGLEVFPVVADNGAIGGSKSEEFMCISDIGEDEILIDTKNKVAINSELLDRPDYKEYLLENYDIEDISSLKKVKAVELGHIFQLGDKYSRSMNATYKAENGKEEYFIMGCYGIGVSRTLAMIYENSVIRKKDNSIEGISLPVQISPYLLYIIPKLDENDKVSVSLEMYDELIANGVPVLFDDRKELSIGAKIKDCKVVGCPYVSVFGKTINEGYIEVENTKTGEKTLLDINDFVQTISRLNIDCDQNIDDIKKKLSN